MQEPEDHLTVEQRLELAQALDEADRGEGVDGWQLLEQLLEQEVNVVEPPQKGELL